MVKGCLGVQPEEIYLGHFCSGTWRGKTGHRARTWQLSHTVHLEHVQGLLQDVPAWKSATVCNYIHTNTKIASHVFNY